MATGHPVEMDGLMGTHLYTAECPSPEGDLTDPVEDHPKRHSSSNQFQPSHPNIHQSKSTSQSTSSTIKHQKSSKNHPIHQPILPRSINQALEEGKVCSLNEDDLREANDVLMEELRKAMAETSWAWLEGWNGLEPLVFNMIFKYFWMIFDDGLMFFHDVSCFFLMVMFDVF